MATKLYVGNLSFDTTENDLQDLFAEAGTVREAVLIQDKMTGKSRGFAFVTMSTDEEAQTATQRLNGKALHGRNLTVNEARPREDFAGAGGGARKSFGGGGGGNRGGGGGVVVADVRAVTSRPSREAKLPRPESTISLTPVFSFLFDPRKRSFGPEAGGLRIISRCRACWPQ